MVNWKLIKYLAPAALLVVLYAWHVDDKHEAIREATSSLSVKYEGKLKEAQKEALKAQNELQTAADKNREEKDEKIKDINTKLNVALSELHKRPQRPPALPQDTNVIQACTARELYREDAEFLTREAARAAGVVEERNYYYQQYEEVRNKLNGTTK